MALIALLYTHERGDRRTGVVSCLSGLSSQTCLNCNGAARLGTGSQQRTCDMDLMHADQILKGLAREQLLVGNPNTEQIERGRITEWLCAESCLRCRWYQQWRDRRLRLLYRRVG